MNWLHLSPVEVEAVKLSLRVSSLAVMFCMPGGVLVAWYLARDLPGKTLVNAVTHLPLVLPPVVVGYLLLVAFGRNGFIGSWLHQTLGITIAFTWKGAALAAGVMAFPLMVRSLRLSFEAVDPGLTQAARTLGASPLRVFFTVTLPLITPGIIAGSILAFARSLGEFGATITFVSNIAGETQTLPLALYTLIQTPNGEAAAARLCGLAIGLSLFALAASEILSRRFQARMRDE